MTEGWPRRVAVQAIVVAALCSAAAHAAALVPIWPFTLFEHFRVQYAVVGALVVAAAAALRVRIYFDVALIALLLDAIPLAADLGQTPRRADGGAPVRVLALNVLTTSGGFAQVRELITEERPDVIGLVEVDQRWLDELAPVLVDYPGRIEFARPDNFGIALYARGRVTGAIEQLGGPLPTAVAEIALERARLSVLLTHPIPPISDEASDQQERQLDAVAARARTIAGPVLVMGDLNLTPWARGFRRLVRRSELCDTRAGFGIQASFPAGMAMMRIPIDHVLASCDIGVHDRRIGRDVGSDHLPVIVDLAVP
ncbi:MAG: endonuclease/exonuclease/phosphatase family protein [Kofleriaceae bacterium]